MVSRDIIDIILKLDEHFRIYGLKSEYHKGKSPIGFYNQDYSAEKEILIIMQNPGPSPDKNEFIAYEQLERAIKLSNIDLMKEEVHNFIEINRMNLINWLQSGKVYFKEIFEVLKQSRMITNCDYEKYLQEFLLKEIYITDINKFRDSRQLKIRKFFHLNIIKQEIDKINPHLVFIFGTDAWSNFQGIFDCIPLNFNTFQKKDIDKQIVDLLKITSFHGHWFKIEGRDTIVIPCCHFTAQGHNQKNLKNLNGINEYKKRILKKFQENQELYL